jgi:hypothetical protein
MAATLGALLGTMSIAPAAVASVGLDPVCASAAAHVSDETGVGGGGRAGRPRGHKPDRDRAAP